MTGDQLRELLAAVERGELPARDAFERVRTLPFADLGFAKVDHHRSLRNGLPEVVFGEGKTAAQIVAIAKEMRGAGHRVLVTRIDPEKAATLCAAEADFVYHATARAAVCGAPAAPAVRGDILVVAAGTSDLPVAEEACVTAEFLGNPVRRLYDVGVAGIHRLLAHQAELRGASVLIVAAGMEGALPSVVGGLVDVPLIAVPTSIGYGANFGGLSALLAMLNSCAAGIVVVNVDNGFGAAVAASRINRA